ncbi:flagellar protein FlaG [Lentibacillus sp. Marseille-P4043]|uniref:flagellar protein FlaG n=1 Tax=Lentibacillus sp. Marseille-P4043 TaxID=2040293 RepID=UPI001F261BE9|nr:flagellar protein FlaG [Lentibacillus sp. Marseille-P4043]
MRLENVQNGSHPLHYRNNNEQMTTAKDRSISELMESAQEQGNTLHNSKEKTNEEDVKSVLSKLNDFMEPLRTNLKFEYHEKLDEYYVTIVNPKTDEVIKEIPPKKMLDMYAAMAEFMGLLVDEKI